MDTKHQAATELDTNSKNTRVRPVFRWLKANGDPSWPAQLVALAHGLTERPNNCGSILNVTLDAAFVELVQKRIDAILVPDDTWLFDRRSQILTLTARHSQISRSWKA
jgi:hypothetical protein